MRTTALTAILTVILLGSGLAVIAQTEREVAARYAPIFHQALGDKPRGDYITNFDFDGDWNGTNNWANAENKNFRLKAYVYYSVAETTTHYLIHYGVFHARDYKGGERKGVILSEILRAGAEVASNGKEPKGMLAEAAIAHENDMEGALVVVDKAASRVTFVETLHHNQFSRYVPAGSERSVDGEFELTDGHVHLYIEPKGHGIEAWGTEREKAEKGFLLYSFSGRADDPETANGGSVGYDLVPIATTLWPKARSVARNNTFAGFKDFGTITISVLSGRAVVSKKVAIGSLASAFDGKVGGINMARPPWGWFSNDRRDDPPGLWFFDPAKVVKRDYGLGESFSTTYAKMPFWALKQL
jgi:hypothetical protein